MSKHLKTYSLSYLNSNKNELKAEFITASSMKEAKQMASNKLTNSNLTNLHKIKVWRVP